MIYYYVYRRQYNAVASELIDSDEFIISTVPAIGSGKILYKNGEFAHDGNVAISTLGRFETLAEARQALEEMFGNVRRVDCYLDNDIVEVYNKERPLLLHHNSMLYMRVVWSFSRNIDQHTTDKELSEFLARVQKTLIQIGYTLSKDVIDIAIDIKKRAADKKLSRTKDLIPGKNNTAPASEKKRSKPKPPAPKRARRPEEIKEIIYLSGDIILDATATAKCSATQKISGDIILNQNCSADVLIA